METTKVEVGIYLFMIFMISFIVSYWNIKVGLLLSICLSSGLVIFLIYFMGAIRLIFDVYVRKK